MRYKILWRPLRDWDELESAVNDYIEIGWRPIGGPCIDGSNIIQAIIKEGETENAD